MIRLSRTLSSVSRVSSWGQTPIRARISGPSLAGSSPRIFRLPPDTGETAAIIRIVEDLPAPLGPRKPKYSPLRTSTSMPRTASTVLPPATKDLRSPDAEIIGSLTRSTLDGPADEGQRVPPDRPGPLDEPRGRRPS